LNPHCCSGKGRKRLNISPAIGRWRRSIHNIKQEFAVRQSGEKNVKVFKASSQQKKKGTRPHLAIGDFPIDAAELM
jgi:hypothetical protein